MARPPGWPAAVPDPQSEQFAERAAAWLLDQAPGEWRGEHTWSKHPLALAFAVDHFVRGALASARQAYASVRRELPPELVTDVLAALEREGARLLALTREVALVREALGGTTWRDRL